MAIQINEVVVRATVCEQPRVCEPNTPPGTTKAGSGGSGSVNEIVEKVLEIIRNNRER